MTLLSDEHLGRHLDRRTTSAPLTGSERENLVASIAQQTATAPKARRGFDPFARRLLRVAAAMAVLVVVAVLVLQLPRADTLPGTSPAVTTPATDGGIAETGSPLGTAPPEPSVVLATPMPDHDAASHAQARAVLDRWEEVVNSASKGAIAFTGFVSYGGGWRGPNAGEQKSAFLSGRIEASVRLPTDEPRPGVVVWENGSRATVPLISAADAFDELRRGLVGGGCPECRPLEVVGAPQTTE